MNPEPRAFLLAVFLLAGCGENLGIDGDPGRLDRTGTVVELCSMGPIDELDLESLSVRGDDLSIGIAYGGGCEEHDFRLCWDGTFMETYPVQVDLELIHDAHGDTCMAYVMESVRFSLVPLREAWIEAYGTESGSIRIDVGGYSTLYDF